MSETRVKKTQRKEVTEEDLLTLPDPPELLEFTKMAQIMITNNMYAGNKQSYQEKQQELQLKLYHAKLLGLPATFANSIYFVHGKVALMVDAMMYLVKVGCPTAEFKITQYEDDKCTLMTNRNPAAKGEEKQPWVTVSWDLERAKRMNLLGKEMWQKDPRELLRSRCYGETCRTVYGKELGGAIYNPEELGEGKE
jgi:hypothetical protein